MRSYADDGQDVKSVDGIREGSGLSHPVPNMSLAVKSVDGSREEATSVTQYQTGCQVP